MRHSPAFHREPTARRSIALFFCRLHSRRPHEFDDSFSEPVQSEWARVSFLIVRNDLSVVEAEFIRPREWIESLGLVKGARLDLAVPELGIDGLAEVTAVRACPPIAEGEGQVVTGRFVTRDVANVVRITLASGTEIRATDVHPVWSIDREDWVPAGKLEPCEMVDTLAGPVAVASVEQLDRHPAVYNLEVHGEHVYRIAVDGVLVHNAGPICVLSTTIDPSNGFRTFSHFKSVFGKAGIGQAWHHIVEQTINSGRFAPHLLHNPANLLNIPHGAGSLHSKVSAYYSSKLPGLTGGKTVREWLSTKSFEEQFQFGIDVIKAFGGGNLLPPGLK